MEDAPRDGRIVRLLVDYSGEDARNPLDDAVEAWTIGTNGFDNDGVDEWQMAGWSWSQDCFTSGEGRVIGWLPFHGEYVPATEDVRYFIEGNDDWPGPMTLAQVHKEIGIIWDAAPGDGWIEGIAGLKVYEARVISRAVETGRSERADCPVCCGGMIADEITEANGGEDCPNCEGSGGVHADDQEQGWSSEHDTLVDYEMQPPLPPLVKPEGGA